MNRLVDGQKITISDDVKLLEETAKRGEPIVLILTDDNSDTDTSFARFAIKVDDATDDIDSLLTDDYLRLVIARFYKRPLEIVRTKRLIVRELSRNDTGRLTEIFNTSGPDIENFFSNYDEAGEYLERYIRDVYEFYGYGIWGLYLRDDLCEPIGIAGFTPRTEGLELSYAIEESHRRKGYAFEACSAIIEYADRNIEHDGIFTRMSKDNEASKGLAIKLGCRIAYREKANITLNETY